jgi:hypothetical protein
MDLLVDEPRVGVNPLALTIFVMVKDVFRGVDFGEIIKIYLRKSKLNKKFQVFFKIILSTLTSPKNSSTPDAKNNVKR